MVAIARSESEKKIGCYWEAKMVRTAALILLLWTAQVPAEQIDPPFDATAKDHVVTAIKDQMVDGDSAKWRWFPAKNANAGVVQYCGFVNAKNRMGGYTGFNPFWVTGRWKGGAFTPVNVEFAQGPYLDGLAARKCIGAGYSMDKIPPE